MRLTRKYFGFFGLGTSASCFTAAWESSSHVRELPPACSEPKLPSRSGQVPWPLPPTPLDLLFGAPPRVRIANILLDHPLVFALHRYDGSNKFGPSRAV